MKLTHKTIDYSVPDIATLEATVGTEEATIIVTDSDRGGVFVYKSADAATNNGGTIFNGWTRQYDGAVNVKWFGAKGDGVTNDTAAIVSALATTKSIYFPHGTYYIGGQDFLLNSNTEVFGEGAVIDWFGTTNGFVINGKTNVTVRNLKFTNTTPSITQAVKLTGSTSKIRIQDIDTTGLYQFAIEASGDFNGLDIHNVNIYNHGAVGVGISMGIEVNPTSASYDLKVSGCYVDMPTANGGSCAKFQNVTNAVITNNIFKRGSGGSPSTSQAVMLGTPTKPISQFVFSDNYINDATTSYGALYITGTEGIVSNNNIDISTTAGVIYIDDLTNVKISNNLFYNLLPINTPNLSSVEISGNKGYQITFDTSVPVDVSNLTVMNNTLDDRIRVSATGTTSNNVIKNNFTKLAAGRENNFSLSNCIYEGNTITCSGSSTNAVISTGTGIVITKNTVECNSNRTYGLFANGLTGNIHMNSFYGYNTAYKTDSGGAPVYFHNNTNGTIV